MDDRHGPTVHMDKNGRMKESYNHTSTTTAQRVMTFPISNVNKMNATGRAYANRFIIRLKRLEKEKGKEKKEKYTIAL